MPAAGTQEVILKADCRVLEISVADGRAVGSVAVQWRARFMVATIWFLLVAAWPLIMGSSHISR